MVTAVVLNRAAERAAVAVGLENADANVAVRLVAGVVRPRALFAGRAVPLVAAVALAAFFAIAADVVGVAVAVGRVVAGFGAARVVDARSCAEGTVTRFVVERRVAVGAVGIRP